MSEKRPQVITANEPPSTIGADKEHQNYSDHEKEADKGQRILSYKDIVQGLSLSKQSKWEQLQDIEVEKKGYHHRIWRQWLSY